MEMKTCCCSPRDRVGGELLTRLLAENEPTVNKYTSTVTSDYRPCRCRRNQPSAGIGKACTPHTINGSSADEDSCCTGDDECAVKNCLSAYTYAMSYSPDQEWQKLFDIEDALSHGTIFTELEFPFDPGCRIRR